MQLSLQTFQQILQRMSAAVQKSASQLVDVSAGSMLRSILEANASIGLWIQWLIIQTLAMTRASTSKGADLDTWMADFSLVRQPAEAAHGVATFSRLSAAQHAIVPAGTLVKTNGGSVAFFVTSDDSNPAWRATDNGYMLLDGIISIDLPITASSPGTSGNVAAGTISLISATLPGIDLVSNNSTLSGGTDGEDDHQFRARFRDYINTRSQATAAAIGYAVSGVHQSVRYKLYENSNPNGDWAPGEFLVVIDDGSGQPDTGTMSIAYAAIDAVRPFGSRFSVAAPVLNPVSVSVVFEPSGAPLQNSVIDDIAKSSASYINALPIGSTLSVTRIAEVVYRASKGPNNISSIAINGAYADLSASPRGVFRVATIAVR